MNDHIESFDLLGFIVNFVVAAILSWILVSLLYWRYGSYSSGGEILTVSTITAIVVGLIAGIFRDGFWNLFKR